MHANPVGQASGLGNPLMKASRSGKGGLDRAISARFSAVNAGLLGHVVEEGRIIRDGREETHPVGFLDIGKKGRRMPEFRVACR
jgi:hypothetical protein